MKRRRYVLLAVTGLALLLLAGVALLYCYGRVSLSEFVDQDLRQLDDNPRTGFTKVLAEFLPVEFTSPRARLNELLEQILPEEFAPKDPYWGFEPWYVWRLKTNGRSRFILFQGQHLFMIPGASAAAIHFLDANGKHEGHSEFCTGWRIDIRDAALVHNELIGAPVVVIQTAPAINGTSIGRQMYGILGNRIALLRLEDEDAKLLANCYEYPNHQIGPAPPTRTEAEWEELLLSSERARVLEALTWIGGRHATEPDPWAGRVFLEQAEAARLVAAVRKRPIVQKKIAELAVSENQWIREAAAMALEQFADKARR